MRSLLATAAMLLSTVGCGGSEPRVTEIDVRPARRGVAAQAATPRVAETPAAAVAGNAGAPAGHAAASAGSGVAAATSPPAPAGGSPPLAADGAAAPPSPPAAAPRPRPSELQVVALSPTRTPLLGGRLTARLPRGAEPIDLGRLSPHAPVLESRHRFIVGQSRFVLDTVELLAVRDGDPEAAVHADVSRWRDRPASFEVKALAGRGGLEVVQVVPTSPRAAAPAGGPASLPFASALYVVSPDETIQKISLYADVAAIQDAAGVAGLARKIAATLAPGGRDLVRSDGATRFTVFARGPELRIDAQRSVTIETPGEDSESYSILPVAGLGHQGGRIDILVSGRTDPYPRRVRRIPGRLLGSAMEWRSYETESGRELRFTHDSLSEGFYLDVRIQGPDREVVERLRRVAESLQMSSPCESPRQCGPAESCRASYCRMVGGGTRLARTLGDLDL